ncbi:MAG TPA: hypothetical protein VIP11_10305 [Gemmatimonadaceae bacterium]
MRMILLRAAAATLLVACSDAAVDPGPKPTETNPQPPRAAFTMRDGSNVANDGAALSLSARRGEIVAVTLDASASSAPGSTISAIEWRVNGAIAGASMTLQVSLTAANTPYQIELGITNARSATAHASGTISVKEIVSTPAIASIDPSSPKASSSDQLVVLNGSGFVAESRVIFTAPSGAATVVDPSPSQSTPSAIAIPVVLGTTGAWSVQVENPGGTRSNAFTFTVAPATVTPTPAPRITSVSPANVTATSGLQTVQLLGQGFRAGLSVTMTLPNGTASTLAPSQVLSVSDELVRLQVDFNAVIGSFFFEVKNPDGQTSNRARVESTAATPIVATITGVSPAIVTGSANPQSLTIQGTNFAAAASVSLRNLNTGQVYSSPTIVTRSSSQIVVSQVFAAAPETWAVDVANPNTSPASFSFSVIAPPAPAEPPVITGVSPNPLVGATNQQTLTILGRNIRVGAKVKLKELRTLQTTTIDQVGVNSEGASVSFAFGIIGGDWTVELINADGRSSGEFTFTVTTPSPIVIASVTPNPIVPSNNQQTLTVTGSGFASGMRVDLIPPTGALQSGVAIGGTPTSFAFPGFFKTTGTWGLRLKNANGVTSAVFPFVVRYPTPVIRSVGPNPAYAVGVPQYFSIGGDFFDPMSTVTLRNLTTGQTLVNVPVEPNQDLVSRSHQMTMSVTFSEPATWTAQVINPGNDASTPFQFSTIAPVAPTLLNVVSPNPVVGSIVDQTIVFNGRDIVLLPTVTFFSPSGATVAASLWSVTTTSVGATARIDVPGTWGVKVTNPGGLSSSILSFNVTESTVTPVITGVTPSTVVGSASAQMFTIVGRDFSDASQVTLRNTTTGQTFTPTVVVRDRTLLGVQQVFGTTAGTWTAEVTNSNGRKSGPFTFQVVAP